MTHSILVVDDTDANRYVLCRCLRQAGYEVIEARSGGDALEKVWARPDLVVLDVKLPDIDGHEVCRRIKSESATRGVLVLNISAKFTGSESRAAGLDNGADAYLVQPMDPLEFLATVRSLLRMRDAERTAVRREARYRALVESSSQAVWSLDAGGALIEHFGFSELLGCPLGSDVPDAWLACFMAEDGARMRDSWAGALASARPWTETGRVVHSGGAVRHVQLRLVPWREQQAGPVAEWIGSASDVSDMVEAQRRLADKVEELARSNQYLEHFAHVLSHDLQEPLRTVTTYLDLIRLKVGAEFDEKGGRYFGYIFAAAQRMRQLITGVLQYSIVTRAPQRERIELSAAANTALANLGPLIEDKHAQVAYDPLPIVDADRTQIEQLFQNLVSNSLKYCAAERAPVVRIGVRTAGGFHHVSVTDNGIGMDPKHLEQVFELFARLHPHEHYEGTGIGLALCRRIVEHHGGRIWAESVPGEGSTFTFTLPELKG